jgi:hypothetical protein
VTSQDLASIRRDGRGYRRRIRILLIPWSDDLVQYLEKRMGQEVDVEVEGVPIKCRVTRDNGAVALRPDEEGRQKILRILRRGHRLVRISLI